MSAESATEFTSDSETAFYLAGHGSFSRPRLIELQYHRIWRYRKAFGKRYEARFSRPAVFIDFQLPRFGMGNVDLAEVPGFENLLISVREQRYKLVFIDVDDTRQRLTPDYEAGFVREQLEEAGAKVLNAFTDDEDAFKRALKDRCGESARDEDVDDSSDFVCFFPSLSSGVIGAALRRELLEPADDESKDLRRINQRIEGLGRLRPYAGGGRPFVDERLSFEWKKPRKAVW
jgi:hypothetical protein